MYSLLCYARGCYGSFPAFNFIKVKSNLSQNLFQSAAGKIQYEKLYRTKVAEKMFWWHVLRNQAPTSKTNISSQCSEISTLNFMQCFLIYLIILVEQYLELFEVSKKNAILIIENINLRFPPLSTDQLKNKTEIHTG